MFYYIVFLFVLRLIIIPFYVRFPDSIFFAQITSSSLIELLDEQRKLLSINPLKENPQLTKAAYLKAEDMLKEDYFGHKSPEGTSGWDWIKKAGYNYKIAGENLAIGFVDSEEVYEAWNDSPFHRENLLNPNFKDVGIAVLKGDFGGQEVTVAVQYFGSPKITEIVREEIVPPAEAKETEPKEVEPKEPEVPEEKLQAPEEKTTSSFKFSFWEFMATKYNLIVEKIVFYSLVFITIVLTFEAFIFTRLYFQEKWTLEPYKASMLKTLFLISLLILLIFFNKQIAIYLIPHQLRI